MDCHFLLQGIFPTQGLNPGLLHCRQTLYHLSHQGSPVEAEGLPNALCALCDHPWMYLLGSWRLQCLCRHSAQLVPPFFLLLPNVTISKISYMLNLYKLLDEAQAGIKIARRNINNLRYADDTTLMAESEELKSLLMKVKQESEKAGLKLNIQKTKIMASGPITARQIDGETMETVRHFILRGSKITADGDCSHEIKRRSLLGRKVMTNLDSIFKSRDITLPTKACLVKAMVFPVVMYGYESWTIKKAGRQRIDAFELWCWRRLLRVPWTARSSNQSILKEISPE